MSKFLMKLSLVSVATAILISHQVDVAFAHPGHGPRERPGLRDDCGSCGSETRGDQAESDTSEREGNSGNARSTRSERLLTDAEQLLNRTQVMQRRIANAGLTVSETAEAVAQSGKISSSERKEVLRSMRSARRANERLADKLGAFLDRYAEDLSKSVRDELQSGLAQLNTQASYLSDHEAKLSDASNCASSECADVINSLYRQGSLSAQDPDITALKQTLSSVETRQDDT